MALPALKLTPSPVSGFISSSTSNPSQPEFAGHPSFEHLTGEISRCASLPLEDVRARVWNDILDPGCNMRQDVDRFHVTPHIYNARMEELYREGYGFIFETMLFWLQPARQRYIAQAAERMRLHAAATGREPSQLRIVIFGDGSANDSLYLASSGFRQIHYFDIPGSRTFAFAENRLKAHNVLGKEVQVMTTAEPLGTGEFDVVISFEVLEHLPNPLKAIREMQAMLRHGGLALVSEAFAMVNPNFPTHLKSNQRFAGYTPFLFLRNGLAMSWYSRSPLYKPMEFTKRHTSPTDLLNLMKDPATPYVLALSKGTHLKAALSRGLRHLGSGLGSAGIDGPRYGV